MATSLGYLDEPKTGWYGSPEYMQPPDRQDKAVAWSGKQPAASLRPPESIPVADMSVMNWEIGYITGAIGDIKSTQ